MTSTFHLLFLSVASLIALSYAKLTAYDFTHRDDYEITHADDIILPFESRINKPGFYANLHSSSLGLTGYDESEAKTYWHLSGASYCARYRNVTRTRLEDWNCDACLQANIMKKDEIYKFYVTASGTAGFVGFSPAYNRIIVSYAGTDPWNVKNIITDITYKFTPYSACANCEVHMGFLNAYRASRPTVIALINGLLDKYGKTFSPSISVTGHSLGGALATHLALDLHNGIFSYHQVGDKIIPVSTNVDYNMNLDETVAFLTSTDDFPSSKIPKSNHLSADGTLGYSYKTTFPFYTYGCPRVGNGLFSSYFITHIPSTDSHKRVVHNRDPVAHLPTLSQGYQHGTQEIFYSKDHSSYDVCSTSTGEDSKCSNKYFFTINILDHLQYLGVDVENTFEQCA